MSQTRLPDSTASLKRPAFSLSPHGQCGDGLLTGHSASFAWVEWSGFPTTKSEVCETRRNERQETLATIGKRAGADRANPLRDLLDGVLVTKQALKRTDIDALPLVDGLTVEEEQDVRKRVEDFAAEILSAAQAGHNGEARTLVREAVDELGEYVGKDENDDPRTLADRVPRTGRTSRMTRADAERADLAKTPR